MSSSIDMKPRAEGMGAVFLKSQFCEKQPAFPALDLSGRVAIITGATTGLGLEAARQLLAAKLSRLVIACRAAEKGEAAAADLRRRFPRAQVDVWPGLEMTSYESVRAFVARVDKDLGRLDIAILNAGVTLQTFEVVPATGHEMVIQVNYLSTMLLAMLLLPSLKTKSPPGQPGRLIIVTSGLALFGDLLERDERPLLKAFDSLDFRKWDPAMRYNNAKMLAHLALIKLKGIVSPDDVVVNLVDPGLSKGTELHRDISGGAKAFLSLLKSLTGRPLPAGGSTYVDAVAVKGKESHGSFLMDWKIHPFPAFVYEGAEAQKVIDVLWEETLDEFTFANVRAILDSMGKS